MAETNAMLDRGPVKRVRDALIAAGLPDNVVALDDSARTAADAAAALGCPVGAIVKSLAYAVGSRFVMALVAGDHLCQEEALPQALKIAGTVRRPQASEVKAITGFTIGGVAPIGLNHALPTVIDISLKRFETIYAAAGHPHCIFAISPASLVAATGGIYSYAIAAPMEGVTPYAPERKRSKTFSGLRKI